MRNCRVRKPPTLVIRSSANRMVRTLGLKHLFLIIVIAASVAGSLVAQADKPSANVPSPSTGNPTDRMKAQADDLYSDGFHLVDIGTAESIRTAEPKFREARRLYALLRDRKSEAYTLNEIVFSLRQLGKPNDALRHADEALQIFRALKNEPKGEAVALNHIGGILLDRGEHLDALKFYQQALPLRRTGNDVGGEAITLNDIASVNVKLGRYEQALESLNAGLVLQDRIGDDGEKGKILSNLGVVNFFLGENKKAIELFESALAKQRGDPRGAAVTLNNIGSVYVELKEVTAALVCYENALPLRRGSGDRRGEAATLLNIGQINSELGQNEKAGQLYRDALEIMLEIGDRTGEAVVTSNIGSQYLAERDTDKAMDHFYRALALSKDVGDLRGQAKVLENLMYTSAFVKDRGLAILFGKLAVNTYQSVRSNLTSLDKELQISFLRTVEESYRTLIELLVKEGRIPEAEQVLRMLKDEEYFQFASRDRSVLSSPGESSLLTPAESKANELLDRELQKDANVRVPQETIAVQERPELNDTAASSLRMKEVLSRSSNRPAAVRPQKSSKTLLNQWNDHRTALVSAVVGEDNLTLIVSTVGFQRGYVREIKEAALKRIVDDYRSALIGGRFEANDPRPAAQALYDQLIKPIAEDLERANVRTVVWSLDKFLRYVPISALWDRDKGFVVERYATVTLALASRQELAFRPANKGRWKILGVGTSKKFGNLEGLRNVPLELSAIVRDPARRSPNRYGMISGRELLDEDFTFQSFRRLLGPSFRFAHAATHFVFIPGTKAEGLDSYLLLGNGEKLTLGRLQSGENLFAGVELLTLSACDTGYGGRTADGREIEGLGVLAQKKGARAIMATLWPVVDESTKDLMIGFYESYTKPLFSKAEALRQAQLKMLGKSFKPGKPAEFTGFGHPYYWSPFVLIGNWR